MSVCVSGQVCKCASVQVCGDVGVWVRVWVRAWVCKGVCKCVCVGVCKWGRGCASLCGCVSGWIERCRVTKCLFCYPRPFAQPPHTFGRPLTLLAGPCVCACTCLAPGGGLQKVGGSQDLTCGTIEQGPAHFFTPQHSVGARVAIQSLPACQRTSCYL